MVKRWNAPALRRIAARALTRLDALCRAGRRRRQCPFAIVVPKCWGGYRPGIRVSLFIQTVCRGDSGCIHSGSCSDAGRSRDVRSHDGVDRLCGTIGTGVVRDGSGVTAGVITRPGEVIECVVI